jgi:hydrogenase nickel incorporation protein HypA/HybF
MHEFSIATGLVDGLLEFIEVHPGVAVLKVRVVIGELACVEPEQLEFCYKSITQGTALDGSELEFEPLTAIVKCPACSYQGPPKYWDGVLVGTSIPTLQCPQCSQAAEAIQGHECQIKSVQVLQDGPVDASGARHRESV